MQSPIRANPYLATTWLLFLGVYVAFCQWLPKGESATGTNLLLCLTPLLANGALLINAVTPDWRKKAFWILLAFGCSLWMAGQVVWTYIEVYQHRQIPSVFNWDIIFFLHSVPLIAALTMQPHKSADDRKMTFSYVDFGVILCWWMYLYVFVVLPWQFVVVDERQYVQAFRVISLFENLVFVGGACMLSMQAKGYWRRIYAHLAAARGVYVVRFAIVELGFGRGNYSRGGLYDILLMISLLWLGTAGVLAYRDRAEMEKFAEAPANEPHDKSDSASETLWASLMARGALLSLALLGFWCLKISAAPAAVREFRILVTVGAVLPLGFLAFLRHDLMDRERLRLLRASQESIDNLRRLQMQFVQSEKLASIGQLVAGAAHEINNPLTAILGYSELLADDSAMGEKQKSLAEKIREQARRTKTLVNNLLSFARQVPSEQRAPIDINAIVNTSAQFRRFDLRGKNIRIEVQIGMGIPEVRADMNQMLQVFSNIINNAVYAMQETGGGTLTVRTLFEKGNVVILFSDTGPGMRDPLLVFDPFYTTKPVGKGTGLGLSICYGLIRDQGGQITCYNRPEGGATFRIDLPAAPSSFPFAPRSVTSPVHSNPAKLA
jgi:signal transduction histidine kinase